MSLIPSTELLANSLNSVPLHNPSCSWAPSIALSGHITTHLTLCFPFFCSHQEQSGYKPSPCLCFRTKFCFPRCSNNTLCITSIPWLNQIISSKEFFRQCIITGIFIIPLLYLIPVFISDQSAWIWMQNRWFCTAWHFGAILWQWSNQHHYIFQQTLFSDSIFFNLQHQ